MQRRSFLSATTVGALSALGLPALADTPVPTQIIVSPLAGPDVAGLYYAVAQGWFKAAGLDVVVQPVPNGGAGMSALVGGAIQIAYTNVLSLSVAHTKGIPVTLIAPGAGYHSATAVAKVLVAGDSAIRTVKDLAGKVVAVPLLGDINTIGLYGLLDQAGVDRTAVRFTEIPPPSMPGALQEKRVDAISIYEPFVSAAVAQGARAIAKPYDSVAQNFIIAAWVAYAPWAAAHRDAVIAFAGVLNRGARYANEHYSELIPMISDFSKMPQDVLGKLAYPTVPATLAVPLIQPVIDAAAKYKAIPASFSARDFIFGGVS
jgi:NitT/TauT family transport system substrate-binding protein